MTKCVYGIYDSKMSEFTQVVLLEDNEVSSYFSHVANDITSPYFRKESDFKVYRLYNLDEVQSSDVFISDLNSYVDDSVRNLQVITQTLNFCLLVISKCRKKMQEHIQEQIKESVYDYVAKYLSNDEKLAISKVVKEN